MIIPLSRGVKADWIISGMILNFIYVGGLLGDQYESGYILGLIWMSQQDRRSWHSRLTKTARNGQDLDELRVQPVGGRVLRA